VDGEGSAQQGAAGAALRVKTVGADKQGCAERNYFKGNLLVALTAEQSKIALVWPSRSQSPKRHKRASRRMTETSFAVATVDWLFADHDSGYQNRGNQVQLRGAGCTSFSEFLNDF